MKDETIKQDQEDNLVYRLRVDETRTEDAGVWRCEISNKAGKASAACTVKVIGTLASYLQSFKAFYILHDL